MGDYAHRVMDAILGSELMPASVRGVLMRRMGYDISDKACIWARGSFRSKNLKIGAGVFINIGFFYDGYDHMLIEDHVRIGQFVRVLTATHDIGPVGRRGPIEVVGKPVRIGAGSWICAGVTILPGVTIAPSCVIAANSLVNRDTEPDGLYAGTPARRVRDLPLDAPDTLVAFKGRVRRQDHVGQGSQEQNASVQSSVV